MDLDYERSGDAEGVGGAGSNASNRTDPLSPDQHTDPYLSVSLRSLVRLALVASEAGARFQRDSSGDDALSWMLEPKRLFGGGSAIEACLRLDACRRATLFHALGMASDADPRDLDALTSEGASVDTCAHHRPPRLTLVSEVKEPKRLFTAVAVDETEERILHVFAAIVSTDPDMARDRIRERHGDRAAAAAVVREGFDASDPLVGALVSPAVSDMLSHAAAAPSSGIARGLEVALSQSFAG